MKIQLRQAPVAHQLHGTTLTWAALRGTALGRLGEPSTASSAAWAAAGLTARTLHDAPLPLWPGRSVDEFASHVSRVPGCARNVPEAVVHGCG